MTGLARTPAPPYWAVIFTSRHAGDDPEYARTAARMVELASAQPGYLGHESVREDGVGITVSYWRSEADVAAWRRHAEHAVAQGRGRADWYAAYELRFARVERATSFPSD